jgi:hypothetical protein
MKSHHPTGQDETKLPNPAEQSSRFKSMSLSRDSSSAVAVSRIETTLVTRMVAITLRLLNNSPHERFLRTEMKVIHCV